MITFSSFCFVYNILGQQTSVMHAGLLFCGCYVVSSRYVFRLRLHCRQQILQTLLKKLFCALDTCHSFLHLFSLELLIFGEPFVWYGGPMVIEPEKNSPIAILFVPSHTLCVSRMLNWSALNIPHPYSPLGHTPQLQHPQSGKSGLACTLVVSISLILNCFIGF